jgi:hypothetical protein
MTMLRVQVRCGDCAGEHCRTCGGSGWLSSVVSKHQFARMGEFPEVCGATVVLIPRRRVRRKAVAR